MKVTSLILLFAANCGAAQIGTRIVGGNYAAAGQFPFQAAIFHETGFVCTGNILNENYIITAAHCVHNGTHVENKLTAVVGTNTWYYGGVTVKIRRSIPHENFAEFYVNDLALLLLEKPLKFTKLIQPIQLLATEAKRLENVTVSGWGQVWTSGPLSDSLKFNLAVVLSADECKRTMKISFPGQICLGRVIRNGNCFGDSGGSAVYKGKLLGITSYGGARGDQCGSLYPDVDTKVSYYVDWIEKTMEDNLQDHQQNLV